MGTPAIDPKAIDELHHGDGARWAELFAQMHADANPFAPGNLAHALVTREPTRSHWFAGARRAAEANPDSSSAAQAREEASALLQWIDRGVAKEMAPSEPRALQWRVGVLEYADDLEGALQLVADFETHAAGTPEHGMALLLASQRLGESERHDEALEMATRASTMFEALGEQDWHRSARLERAACLLSLHRFEDGLEIVEQIVPGPRGRLILPRLGGVRRLVGHRDRRLSAVAELVSRGDRRGGGRAAWSASAIASGLLTARSTRIGPWHRWQTEMSIRKTQARASPTPAPARNETVGHRRAGRKRAVGSLAGSLLSSEREVVEN